MWYKSDFARSRLRLRPQEIWERDYVKHLLKDKHPALQLSESAYCKSNQSAPYSHLFKEEFEAHDALEDVKEGGE